LSGAWSAAAEEVFDEFGAEGLDQFLWAAFGELLGPGDRKDVRDEFLDRRVEQQRLFLEGLGLICKSDVAEDYRTGSWRLSRRGELSGIKSPTGGVLTASLKASDLRDAASAWRSISLRLGLSEYQRPSARHWSRVWCGHVYQRRRVTGLRAALVAELRRREEAAHASN
jgi:hypothetical protein